MWTADAQAATNDSRSPDIHIYNAQTSVQEQSFLAFGSGFRGGATVATGDVNGDGIDEIIAGAGPGGTPQVRVFASSGEVLSQFFGYPKNFRGGVKVASCDFNNDGINEILVGPGQGGTSQVRIFSEWGEVKYTPGFAAFAKSFRGGVNVACGDVNGDGFADIVADVGVGASPQVKVFNRYGKQIGSSIIPYADRDRGGVAVAVGNVDGGKESEIITAIHRFGRSLVKVYRANAQQTIIGQFEGWPESFQGGYSVATGDLDNDHRDEILVGLASGGKPQLRAFEAYGKPLGTNFLAYASSFLGGVNIATGKTEATGNVKIVTAPGRNTIQGSTAYQKYVEVRISEQRLYAYENGKVVRTFLVSTGINKYPTPTGTFSILAKVQKKDYEWSYGENHPDNYDIKDVEWNLRFAPSFYLHYAFWHHNFGHRMSHGCVNIDLTNAKWIYEWADVGMPVIISS
ncbi:MAG: L,D-transpeptidase family protein [bacterium]